MKKIFSAFVLSFVMITSANAEHEKTTYNSQKPVSCASTDNVTKLLGGTFKEMPYMQGDGLAPALDGGKFIKTNIVIALNLETQTFSVVEIINEKLACIIAGGNNFRFNKPVGNKTNISLEK